MGETTPLYDETVQATGIDFFAVNEALTGEISELLAELRKGWPGGEEG